MDDRDRLITDMAVALDNINSVRGYLADIENRLYTIETTYKRVLGEETSGDALFSDLLMSIFDSESVAKFDDPPDTFDDLLMNDKEFRTYWANYYDDDCYCDSCARYASITFRKECSCDSDNATDYRMD